MTDIRKGNYVAEIKKRIEWNGEVREVLPADTSVIELSSGHYVVSDGTRFIEVFEQGGKLSDGNTLDQVEMKVESDRERIIRERFSGLNGADTLGGKTGAHLVKAPMPGLVRAIKVAVGDPVERTSTLVILEAMKMENNIVAGAKGRVQKVLIGEGSSVEKNATLIEIELA